LAQCQPPCIGGNADARANRSRTWYESAATVNAGAGGLQESPMPFSRLAAVFLVAGSLATATSTFAQTPPPPPPAAPAPPSSAAPAPKAGDAFGEEVTLTAKTIVFSKGSANWDSAFETLVEAFKNVYGALQKQGLKPSGPPMTIYTATDDTGFEYQAGVPVTEDPKGPLPEGMAVGKSPDGRALKFIHRGSYDAMDSTYEAITNHLDEKRLEARDLFVEYYVTDPLTTPEDNLVIEVYVPIK
jgi:effector-binding domain-containing protein